MIYNVLFIEDATRDLDDIYDFIALHDDTEKAEYVIAQIESTCKRLSEFPFRGVSPVELVEVEVDEYREIFFKPYRIFYTIVEKSVYVVAIIDGRRDMRTFLQRRILKGRTL